MFLKIFLSTFLTFFNLSAIYGMELGDKCDSNYYCSYIYNAECKDYICQCAAGTIQDNGACLQDINPKKSCLHSFDCNSLHKQSICVDGFCRCVNAHHFRDGGCFVNKHPYAYCQADKECYVGIQYEGSMVCEKFKCECNTGYKFRDGRCRNGAIKNISELKYLSVLALLIITIF